MKRFFISIIFILIIIIPFSYGYISNEFSQKHALLKKAVENDEKASALLILQSMKSIDGRAYDINNYSFLEAYLKSRLGKTAEAAQIYEELLKSESILKDYILLELSLIYRSENPRKAIECLEQVRSDNDSILKWDALKAVAEIYVSIGDYKKAISYYNLLGKKGGSLALESRYQSALLYEKQGKYSEAAALFYQFITKYKKSDQAVKSLKRLEEIEKKTGRRFYTDLSYLYQKGMAAFLNWNFDLCTKYFYDVYISNEKRNPLKPDALYYLARTYERSGSYEVAAAYYLELIKTYPKSRWEQKGLYQLGRLYFLSGRNEAAVSALETLISKNPSRTFLSNSMFLLFQNAVARGDYYEALKLSSYFIKKFPSRDITRKIQFECAVIYFQRSEYYKALDIINSLLKSRRLPVGIKPELLFWKGRIYENLGDTARSNDIFLDIITLYPNDFYRYLAQDRLKLYFAGRKKDFYKSLLDESLSIYLAGKEEDSIRNLSLVASVSPYSALQDAAREKLKVIFSRNPHFLKALSIKPYPERPVLQFPIKRAEFNIHFLKASEFAFLGLYQLAAEEFRIFRGNDYEDLGKILTLATYYSKAGNPNRALFWAESLTRLMGDDLDYVLLPDGVKELLFPNEFEQIVDSFTNRRGIDKFFVLALIREESKFKPTAKSPQTARGLMQFIPSTARDLAAELGLEDFELDDLYSPEFNINLGTQYLANLMKNFNNNHLYVLSAYNSGEANTKRWKERCRSNSPEEFIVRIDYPETRNYVKRVMASFRIYQTLNASNQ